MLSHNSAPLFSPRAPWKNAAWLVLIRPSETKSPLPGLAGPTRTTLPTHRISTNGRLGRAETFFRQDRQYFLGTSRENRHVGDYELKQSRYLIPDPVLKITTCSPMSIFPDARSFFSATKQAAPSGATKRPSFDPTSRTARIISSSSTAIAPPLESRRIFSIKKSPIAFGTRKPDATVCAFGNSAANFSPASKARTIGAQPLAWTENIRGRLLFATANPSFGGSIQPSFSISSNAFHIPISPVPPPVGYKITSGNFQSSCPAIS